MSKSHLVRKEFGSLLINTEVLRAEMGHLLVDNVVIAGADSGGISFTSSNVMNTIGSLAFFSDTTGNVLSNNSLYYTNNPTYTYGVGGVNGGQIITKDNNNALYLGSDICQLTSHNDLNVSARGDITLYGPNSSVVIQTSGNLVLNQGFVVSQNGTTSTAQNMKISSASLGSLKFTGFSKMSSTGGSTFTVNSQSGAVQNFGQTIATNGSQSLTLLNSFIVPNSSIHTSITSYVGTGIPLCMVTSHSAGACSLSINNVSDVNAITTNVEVGFFVMF